MFMNERVNSPCVLVFVDSMCTSSPLNWPRLAAEKKGKNWDSQTEIKDTDGTPYGTSFAVRSTGAKKDLTKAAEALTLTLTLTHSNHRTYTTSTNTSTTIQHDFFNYFSSGIDGGVENRPVVDNVLRPNPEACHIRYLPPYTY